MGRLESGSRRLRRTHPTHPSPFLEHTQTQAQNAKSSFERRVALQSKRRRRAAQNAVEAGAVAGEEMLPTTTQPAPKSWWQQLRGTSSDDAAPPPPPPPPPKWQEFMATSMTRPTTQAKRDPLRPMQPHARAPPLPRKHLPPPPPRSSTFSLFIHKPRGAALGIKFFGDRDDTNEGDSKKEGAEVVNVEAFGLAWRSGIKVGDRILSVRVFSTIRPLEVLSESEIRDGYTAAKALRPAVGRIELRMIRHVPTREESAVTSIAAAWRGFFHRTAPQRWCAAAIFIQSAWRRTLSVWTVQEMLDQRCVVRAAVRIQSSWRKYDAWLQSMGRYFAIQHIQRSVRAWLLRRPCGGSAGKSTGAARRVQSQSRAAAAAASAQRPPLLQRNASPGGTPTAAIATTLTEEEVGLSSSTGSASPSRGRKRMRSSIRAPPRLEW